MMAYLTTLVVLVSVAALVGLALNFQWGVAGLVNFGVVGFVALGAYAAALLSPALGWFGGMIAAAAICAVASTLLGVLIGSAGRGLSGHRYDRLRRNYPRSPPE